MGNLQMSGEYTKAREIKRLTTPLNFDNSKAYDSEGNLINCVETLSEVKFIVEPNENILTDDEIMQYAPDSKAASRIKLKRGIGNSSDLLLVNESIPWLLGIYYVILISISLPVVYFRNSLAMLIILVLYIVPLVYSYRLFNLKSYENKKSHPLPKTDIPNASKHTNTVEEKSEDINPLKNYVNEINNLKVLFDVKERVVRDLIEKRFEPPQLTYDKFISMIDSCHRLFYLEVDSAEDIINLAEDSPRIRQEIENKIDIMKKIINQIEDLTNELVLNINSDSESETEVKVLLDDMENLIGSVKDYNGD